VHQLVNKINFDSCLYTNTHGAIVQKGNIFSSIAVKISDLGL